MRQSVLICEGSTDYALLQYYMRKALGWTDVNDRDRQGRCVRNPGQKSRLLGRDESELTIMAAGGSTRIREALRNVLKRMKDTPPDGSYIYGNIAIVTDRDEEVSEESMLHQIDEEFAMFQVTADGELTCKKWLDCRVPAKTGLEYAFRILVLVIPFDEYGAMETFLLEAVSAQDSYDKTIVEKAGAFVDSADPEKRYLTKRGYITKAKFDAFFCVRTSASQFNERQNILLSADWENYDMVNDCFRQFREL